MSRLLTSSKPGCIGLAAGVLAVLVVGAQVTAREPANAMQNNGTPDGGALSVVTDAHDYPYEFYAEDGKTVIGLEADLWQEIARRLHRHIQVSSVDFSGLIPGVQSGRYKLGMECLTDSPVREQQITFIDYARSPVPQAYALKTAGFVPHEPMDLCGRKVAMQVGLDYGDDLDALTLRCKAKGKLPVSIMAYPSLSSVLMALYSGRVDFIIGDNVSFSVIQEHAHGGVYAVDIGAVPKKVGVIVNRNDPDTERAVFHAFRSMKSDGTYDRLFRKWNAVQLEEQGNITINGATAATSMGGQEKAAGTQHGNARFE